MSGALSTPAGPPLRIVYIAGAARSGSTLLEQLLAQSYDVVAIGEIMYVWDRGFRLNERCSCASPSLNAILERRQWAEPSVASRRCPPPTSMPSRASSIGCATFPGYGARVFKVRGSHHGFPSCVTPIGGSSRPWRRRATAPLSSIHPRSRCTGMQCAGSRVLRRALLISCGTAAFQYLKVLQSFGLMMTHSGDSLIGPPSGILTTRYRDQISFGHLLLSRPTFCFPHGFSRSTSIASSTFLGRAHSVSTICFWWGERCWHLQALKATPNCRS